jgi:phosphoribosylformylglycinamidine cyclo-ligase
MKDGDKNSSSPESQLYAALGASSSKKGVHAALDSALEAKQIAASGAPSGFFASVCPDVAGDPEYWSLLHADGAGTKSIPAYLAYRESGDPKWFRFIAYDSFVMNIDDIACVGAFEGLVLSNTIGRNRTRVPDEVIRELITGYNEVAEILHSHGVPITLAGGETADVGDLVRTVIVDSTLFARVKKSVAINTHAIQTGDCIIGLSSTGKATFETKENSGIGSNGITLARHALIPNKYATKYPEILDEGVSASIAYRGTATDLFAQLPGSSLSYIEALLSPTRTYAPLVKQVHQELGKELHGAIHCSGGGLTKILRFGKNKRYIKNNLFPTPPLFLEIQRSLSVPWNEMYSVLNMGHRMELVVPHNRVQIIQDIAASYNIEARAIGYVEEGNGNSSVQVSSAHGIFEYTL